MMRNPNRANNIQKKMIDYGLLLPEKRRVLAHGVPRPLVRHARGEADAKAAADVVGAESAAMRAGGHRANDNKGLSEPNSAHP